VPVMTAARRERVGAAGGGPVDPPLAPHPHNCLPLFASNPARDWPTRETSAASVASERSRRGARSGGGRPPNFRRCATPQTANADVRTRLAPAW
jgi:hypothetical protein